MRSSSAKVMIEESVYEAQKAVQQSSSSFIAMEVKEHVTLLPSYLGRQCPVVLVVHLSLISAVQGRVGTGVTEELASRILHYHAVYGGVLMAFDRIRVIHR